MNQGWWWQMCTLLNNLTPHVKHYVVQGYYPYGGSTVQFYCEHEQYKLVGPGLATCFSGQWWPNKFPKCELKGEEEPDPTTCEIPKIIDKNVEYKVHTKRGDKIRPGSYVTFKCPDTQNWKLVGHNMLACTDLGQWTHDFPRCDSLVTEPPPVITTTAGPDTTIPPDTTAAPDTTAGPDTTTEPVLPSTTQQIVAGCPKPAPSEDRTYQHNNAIQNQIQGDRYRIGTQLNYSCNTQMYEPVDQVDRIITCTDLGTWDKDPPVCKPKNGQRGCHKPPIADDAKITYTGHINYNSSQIIHPHGSVLTFQCNPNDGSLKLVGEQTITCNNNNQWGPALPQCVPVGQQLKPCAPPQLSEAVSIAKGGNQQMQLNSYPSGSELTFSCVPSDAYIMTGIAWANCSDGSWSDLPDCKPIPTTTESILTTQRIPVIGCPKPATDEHLKYKMHHQNQKNILTDMYDVGTVLIFYCMNEMKHQLVGIQNVTCKDTGEWDIELPLCRERQAPPGQRNCPRPPVTQGITFSPNQQKQQGREHYAPGSTLRYSCSPPELFVIATEYNIIKCGEDGKWDQAYPTCRSVVTITQNMGCIKPPATSNELLYEVGSQGAELNQTHYKVGAVLMYRCIAQFILIGAPKITCQPSSVWDSAFPNCQIADQTTTPVTDVPPITETSTTPSPTVTDDTTTEGVTDETTTEEVTVSTGTGQDGRECLMPRVHPGVTFKRSSQRTDDMFSPGETLTYSCEDPSHEFHGHKVIRCRRDGNWDHIEPRCEPKDDDDDQQ